MTSPAMMKMTIYKNDTDLELPAGHEPTIGDKFEVYRGDGPREGECMGTATIRRSRKTGPCSSTSSRPRRSHEYRGNDRRLGRASRSFGNGPERP